MYCSHCLGVNALLQSSICKRVDVPPLSCTAVLEWKHWILPLIIIGWLFEVYPVSVRYCSRVPFYVTRWQMDLRSRRSLSLFKYVHTQTFVPHRLWARYFSRTVYWYCNNLERSHTPLPAATNGPAASFAPTLRLTNNPIPLDLAQYYTYGLNSRIFVACTPSSIATPNNRSLPSPHPPQPVIPALGPPFSFISKSENVHAVTPSIPTLQTWSIYHQNPCLFFSYHTKRHLSNSTPSLATGCDLSTINWVLSFQQRHHIR